MFCAVPRPTHTTHVRVLLTHKLQLKKGLSKTLCKAWAIRGSHKWYSKHPWGLIPAALCWELPCHTHNLCNWPVGTTARVTIPAVTKAYDSVSINAPSMVPSQEEHPEDRLPEEPRDCFEVSAWAAGPVIGPCPCGTGSVCDDSFGLSWLPLLFFLIVQMYRVPSNEPQLSRQQGAECSPHPQSWLPVIAHLICTHDASPETLEEYVLPIKVNCYLFIRMQFLEQAPFVS